MPYDPRRYVPDYSYKARAAEKFGRAATGLAEGIGSAVQTKRTLDQEEKTAEGLRDQFTNWLSKLKPEILQEMGIEDPLADVPDPSGMRLDDYQNALKLWFKPKRNSISTIISDPDTLENLIKGSPVNIEKEVGAAKTLYRKGAIDEFLQKISETQPGSQEAAQMAREAQISDDPRVAEAIGRIRGREQITGMGEAGTTEEAVRGGIGSTMQGGQAYPLEGAAGQYAKTYGTKQQQADTDASKALADKRRFGDRAVGEPKPSEEHLYAIRKQIDSASDNIASYEGRIKGVEEQIAKRKELERKLGKEDVGFAEKMQLQEELSKLGSMTELAATKKRIQTMQDREKKRLNRYEKQEEIMLEDAQTRAERTAAEAKRRQDMKEKWDSLSQVLEDFLPRGETGVDMDDDTVNRIRNLPEMPEDIRNIITPGLFNMTVKSNDDKPIIKQGGISKANLNNKQVQDAILEGYTVEEIIEFLQQQTQQPAAQTGDVAVGM